MLKLYVTQAAVVLVLVWCGVVPATTFPTRDSVLVYLSLLRR